MGLRKLLDDPNGGQSFSVAVAVALALCMATIVGLASINQLIAGRGDWWLGLAPLFASVSIILRLLSKVRSRNAR